MTLHAVVRFGIAEAIPLDEPITFEAVAKKVGLSTDRVTRLLRHSITNNLFEEPRAGYVGHTALSSIIVREPLSRSWILHNFEEIATTKFLEAYDKYGETDEPTETATSLAFDYFTKHPKDNLWTFLENDGEGEQKGYRMRRFAEAMVWVSGHKNDQDMILATGFDWASLGEATVADVSPHSNLQLLNQTNKHAPGRRLRRSLLHRHRQEIPLPEVYCSGLRRVGARLPGSPSHRNQRPSLLPTARLLHATDHQGRRLLPAPCPPRLLRPVRHQDPKESAPDPGARKQNHPLRDRVAATWGAAPTIGSEGDAQH